MKIEIELDDAEVALAEKALARHLVSLREIMGPDYVSPTITIQKLIYGRIISGLAMEEEEHEKRIR